MRLRKLNEQGLDEFEAWVEEGADGPVPLSLLTDPATSAPVTPEIRVPSQIVGSRFELGRELVRLLEPLDAAAISHDRLFWTSLALVWFDQICPPLQGGRKPS